MNDQTKRFTWAFPLALTAGLLLASPAHAADAPPLVPIQGSLANSAGVAIDGTHDLRFSLYGTQGGTTPLYTEVHAAVDVANGDFVVYLGDTQPLALSLFRDNAQLWLEVAVDDTETIAPRFRLATAPYAASALYCGDAATVGGSAPSAFAGASHTHAFSSLTGVPTGLADGDNDLLATLSCTNGQVAQRGASAWSCATLAPVATSGTFATLTGIPAGLADGDDDLLATLSCGSGQVAKYSGSAWACAADDNTALPAGLLTGAGTAGYLARYTDTATLAGSSVFQDSGGNIAIAPGGLELGDSGGNGTAPYVDFHFGIVGSQDYNVRVVNAANGELRILSNTLRMQEATAITSPNIVLGYSGNTVADGVVGGTIVGGGKINAVNSVTRHYGTVGGGFANVVDEEEATVSGGRSNTASGFSATVSGGASNVAANVNATVGGGCSNTASGFGATVGGGNDNTASGGLATVSGGIANTASGNLATVSGGYVNTAAGDYSFAAGRQAKSNQAGCFTWADSQPFDWACDAPNAFTARATGGVYFATAINGSGTYTAGVAVGSGSGSWSSMSDRNAKRDITPVNPVSVLAALERVPISTWRYKTETSGALHMGPMAQDFHAAFGLGDSDKSITTVDADGVALAAVEALHDITKGQTARIDGLAQTSSRLSQTNAELARDNADLRARLERLEQRLGPAPASVNAGMLGTSALALLALGLAFGRRRSTNSPAA